MENECSGNGNNWGKFNDCPCTGNNLEKLIQPTILTLLLGEDLHGYSIVQKLQESCMLHGKKPDLSGVYRTLRLMEQRGLVTAVWKVSAQGPAKRRYGITAEGLECLQTWIETLTEYHHSLGLFLTAARDTLLKREN